MAAYPTIKASVVTSATEPLGCRCGRVLGAPLVANRPAPRSRRGPAANGAESTLPMRNIRALRARSPLAPCNPPSYSFLKQMDRLRSTEE